MLTSRRAATIRAALKYWSEEMAPHDADVQRPYYDDPGAEPLGVDEIEDLRRQFLPERLRFVRIDEAGDALNPPLPFEALEEPLASRRIAALLLPPQE